MKIDAQNIEEVIFDFHEGNLSDAEKAALMDFMHKHPEYEREFALWAKSYHYADESLPEYGHDDRFLKANPLPVSYKWMGLAASASLIFLMWFWWPKEISREKEIKKRVEVETKSSPIISTKTTQPNPIKKELIKELAAPVPSLTDIERPLPEENVVTDTFLYAQKNPLQVEKKDSVAAMQQVQIIEPKEKQVPVSTSPKKVKRKRKLDLTPTDHILPFNSDF